MDMASLKIPPELTPVIAFHGHLCPGLLIGWYKPSSAALLEREISFFATTASMRTRSFVIPTAAA